MNKINRKGFVNKLSMVAAGVMVPSLFYGQTIPVQPRPQKGPPLDKELVKEFVTIAHSDFDKVKAMLKETPDLLNACYSWTDWDWEDAIGAAGHMGSRDMAIYLLDQGARPTIHVAAMLGQIGVVRSFIDDLPQMKNALGPHKLSLMHHAKKGGSYSKAVVNYLLSAGIKA